MAAAYQALRGVSPFADAVGGEAEDIDWGCLPHGAGEPTLFYRLANVENSEKV
jgi:hypothetical protein